MNTKNPTGPVGLKSSKSGSNRMRIILSTNYNPRKKQPSRRDKHRLGLQNKSPHKNPVKLQTNEKS